MEPRLNTRVHPSQHLKRHVDRFGHFTGLMIVTDRPCYSVCNYRLHLLSTAMWRKN